MKLQSSVKALGVMSAISASLAMTPKANAQYADFSGLGTITALSGQTEWLPPGVTQNSPEDSTYTFILGINTSNPLASTLSLDFVNPNGPYTSELDYNNVTVNLTGSTVTISGSNDYSTVALNYTSSISGGNLETILDQGVSAGTIDLNVISPFGSQFGAAEATGTSSVTAVPEPTTLALAAMALGGTFALRRKYFGPSLR